MENEPNRNEALAFTLRAGVVVAAVAAAVVFAEVELGVACLVALVKLVSDLPRPDHARLVVYDRPREARRRSPRTSAARPRALKPDRAA